MSENSRVILNPSAIAISTTAPIPKIFFKILPPFFKIIISVFFAKILIKGKKYGK